MRILLQALLYAWQLPQNLLGLLVIAFTRPSAAIPCSDCYSVVRASYRMRGGISLGRYAIISTSQCTTCTIRHELGHCRQSRMLGPLYLIVIGLPSIIWAALHSRLAPRKSYYWFYTERCADRLGGVERPDSPSQG